RELSHLAPKERRAIRKEDLGLAHPSGVEQQLPRPRMARRVLITEAQVELAERYPRRLAAPPRLDQLCLERQHVLKRVTGLRRELRLEAGDEAKIPDFDLYVHRRIKIAPPPQGGGA